MRLLPLRAHRGLAVVAAAAGVRRMHGRGSPIMYAAAHLHDRNTTAAHHGIPPSSTSPQEYLIPEPPQKPPHFAHVIVYQQNSDPKAAVPMRVYQSKEPTLLPQIHLHDNAWGYMTEAWARHGAHKVACIQLETGESITYGQLLERTNRVSGVLYNLYRVRHSHHVLLCMFNTIDFAPLAYGIMGIGAVLTTTNVLVQEDLLVRQMEWSDTRLVITVKYCLSVVQRAAQQVKARLGYDIKILLVETIMKQSASRVPVYHNAKDVCGRSDKVLVPFSAGTSGNPKGVQVTNLSLSANIQQAIQTLRLSPSDVQLSVIPFFHITGFTLGLSTTLAAGGTLVIQSKFDVHNYLKAIEQYKVSSALVTPPIVAAITRHMRVSDDEASINLSSLRLMRCTGTPLSPALWADIQKIFPHTDFGQLYGMTEMSPLAVNTPVYAHGGNADVPPRRGNRGLLLPVPSSVVGALVADTEMRIVHVDDSQQAKSDVSRGVDVEEGHEGEIWLCGPQRMGGYVDRVATDAAIVHDRWYRTGDIGYVDRETGYLCITDRLTELIKYKGFYVSPAKVEAVLAECPEVGACVVFGVPDQRDASFETPRAWVVLAPGAMGADTLLEGEEKQAAERALESALIRHVESRLPTHKRLHGGIRFVQDIPRTENGKLKRRMIRKLEMLHLAQEAAASD